MVELLELAERCEQAAGLDKVALVELEADIRNAVEANPDHPFTVSLDAAMTLVPPGWEPLIDGVGSERAKRWIVELYPEDGSDRIEHGAADTSPLALCAAALRAKAAAQ